MYIWHGVFRRSDLFPTHRASYINIAQSAPATTYSSRGPDRQTDSAQSTTTLASISSIYIYIYLYIYSTLHSIACCGTRCTAHSPHKPTHRASVCAPPLVSRSFNKNRLPPKYCCALYTNMGWIYSRGRLVASSKWKITKNQYVKPI